MFELDYPTEARILALMEVNKKKTVSDEELYAVFEWFYGDFEWFYETGYGRPEFNRALTWLNQQRLVICDYQAERNPQVIVEMTETGKILAESSLLSLLLSD